MNFQGEPPHEADDHITGVVIGIVSDNDDPEGLGRVKLRFPWRTAEDESHWARIAVPMAGPDRGTYFLPEEGDEVLVAFEDGDIHHPYVVGALWNGQDEPPADNADGNNDIRTVRSRSGHEIRMNDSDTEGRVEITTNGGHSIVLDDATGSETITIDDGQNTIEFDSTQGAVTVSGGTKLSLDAPMLELNASGNLDIQAGGVLTLQGSLININ